MNDILKTLDLIYEAAFVPERWREVLDVMANGAGGHGTALFNTGKTAARSLASDSLADLTQKMVNEGWLGRNSRAARLLTIEHEGFINEADYFTAEDYNSQPIFTQVMQPLGYGFGTSTFITAPSGDRMIFAVEKKAATGPVTTSAILYLDSLRPHLARAAMMSSRLEFERVRAATEALQIAGLPAAVLRADGVALAVNDLLERMSPRIVTAAFDRIRFQHAPANSFLARLLERSRVAHSGASGSLPLPRVEDHPAAVVHVVPVEGGARDIFTNAALFMIITPVDRQRLPSADIIRGLFDLTPAEAKVARELATGSDVAAVAEHLSVGRETVRSHVKAILSKTGMSRQADFIAAIASIRTIEQ